MSDAFKPFTCMEQKLSGLGNGSEWHFKIRIWIYFYLYFIWYSCIEKRRKIFTTVVCFKDLLQQYQGLKFLIFFIETMWGFVDCFLTTSPSGTNLASFFHRVFRVIENNGEAESGETALASLTSCQELILYQYLFLMNTDTKLEIHNCLLLKDEVHSILKKSDDVQTCAVWNQNTAESATIF